jgi:ubiquitin C-terminal hydrolase
VTLLDLLRNYFSPTEIEGKCDRPSCMQEGRLTQEFLAYTGSSLVITLKRNKPDKGKFIKYQSEVQYGEMLDLSDFKSLTCVSFPRYELYAVIEHKGPSFRNGHYVAEVKSFCDGEWYRCDNTSMTANSPSAPQTKQPYMLFYSRIGHNVFDLPLPR